MFFIDLVLYKFGNQPVLELFTFVSNSNCLRLLENSEDLKNSSLSAYVERKTLSALIIARQYQESIIHMYDLMCVP